MTGQITLTEYKKSRYYDRSGRTEEAPAWVNEERCGNCSYWTILQKEEQPPAGWGVKGLCGSHRGQNMHKVDQCSYCSDYRERGLED